MRRREFITLVGGAAVGWSSRTLAQQSGGARRVSLIMGYPEGDLQAQANVVALREGLQRLGWVEGRTIQLDYRWAGPDPVKARAFAKELVATPPDVIVSSTNQVTGIMLQETHTIPIVFAFVGDPVGDGFVASLRRPGGNITGFANFENSIGGKWLELFKEIVPLRKRVGFVFSPDAAPNRGFLQAAELAAQALTIKVVPLPVRQRPDIEQAIKEFASEPEGGLIIAPHAVTLGNRHLIVELAAHHQLPAVYSDRYFAESGGLLSFGNNTADLFRRAASYVDLVLKGANPADLPVQLPAKFELIVNLKTAKALGIDIPRNFLTRADDVIE